MRALAADGDHAAMILAYRDLRLFLRQEVNAEPDDETVALYERLRADFTAIDREEIRIRRGHASSA